MKDIEDKLQTYLMDHGVLKNRDAKRMARHIIKMVVKSIK